MHLLTHETETLRQQKEEDFLLHLHVVCDCCEPFSRQMCPCMALGLPACLDSSASGHAVASSSRGRPLHSARCMGMWGCRVW